MKIIFKILFLIVFISELKAKIIIRLTKIIREISGKTVPQKPICYIKTFDKHSHKTIRYNISRKVPNFHKNSDEFRKVVEFKGIEILKILTNINAAATVSFVKTPIDYLKKMANGNLFRWL
jgi:hypothetical protein